MLNFQITVCLLASLFSVLQGQDLSELNKQFREALLRRQLLAEYGANLTEVTDDLTKLNKIWDVRNKETFSLLTLGGSSERRSYISPECSEAANSTYQEKDSFGLPLIVDLLDAGGKLGPGLLTGNFFVTGAFDQCLNLQGKTKYCNGPLHFGLPFTLKTYFCIPNNCTSEDLAFSVNLTRVLSIDASQIECLSTKKPPYHWTAILMIFVCIIIGSVVAVSTIVDLLLRLWKENKIQLFIGMIPDVSTNNGDENSTSDQKPLLPKPVATPKKAKKCNPTDWIQAFSLYKTIPTVLSTKQTSAAITCLNGIRVISMFWVILGHVHLVVSLIGVDNSLDIKDVMGRFSFQAVNNAYVSVDSFFLLSGVLLAYLTLRQMKRRNGRFPFVMFYVHRYLRLTPVYAFVLFFTWFLIMHLAGGPSFTAYYVGGPNWNNCEKYWWTNLLYINNFYPWKLSEECLNWSWYLANDMQFFIISPLIIIPMYFLFPLGAAIAGIFLFVSFLVTAVLTGVFDLQPNSLAVLAYNYTAPNVTADSQDLLYIKPYHRIQPYLVGLVLGYLLYKRVRIPFNRFFKLGSYLFMWGLAIIFCTSTLYGLYGTWHGHVPSLVENIFYNTFSRFTWAVGLALLVFICHNGYGGWVNTFLSMKIWTPLSRLTFNAYLVHPVVVIVVFGSARKAVHYMDVNMAVYAIACVAISFGVAFIVAVCVEFPFGNLEMAFFKIFGVGNRESTRTDTEAKGSAVTGEGAQLKVKKYYN